MSGSSDRKCADAISTGRTHGPTTRTQTGFVSRRDERRRSSKQIARDGAAMAPAHCRRSRRSPPRGRRLRRPASSGGRTLARYAIDLTYEDLPPEVVRTTKRTILDTVGLRDRRLCAGRARIAIKLRERRQRSGRARRSVRGIKTSHELRGVANGVMIRYLDFNDGYITPKRCGHPSDTIAALLSSAEIAGQQAGVS